MPLVKPPIIEIQQNHIRKTLESILKNGLCSLKKIPSNDAIPNKTFTDESTHSLCVNYLNLVGCTTEERRAAIQTAVYEEYTGILGVALERTWPLQKIDNEKIAQAELIDRLINVVVFILEPPKNHPLKAQPFNGTSPVDLAFYEGNADDLTGASDGFSQSRGKLLSNKSLTTKHVTEIKTLHTFNLKEIKAILVPEPLFELVKTIFIKTRIDILAVPTEVFLLEKIPEMLFLLHNQKLNKPLNVHAPKFEEALNNFVKNQNCNQFSIHAVRLHTPFDFTVRFLKNIETHTSLIKKIEATIFDKHGDDGWVLVHKCFSVSKKANIEQLKKLGVSQKSIHLTEAEAVAGDALIAQLMKAKGENKMGNVYAALTTAQINMLDIYDVSIIELNNYYVISYSENKEKKVLMVIDNWEHVNQLVTTLQAAMRGYNTRTLFLNYKQAAKKLAAAQTEFSEAEQALFSSSKQQPSLS